MSFLPIVERELRVRSRQAWTYYLRCLAAGIGLLLGGVFFLAWGTSMRRVLTGQQLFYSLTVLAFLACLFEGARDTSDCLCGERRQGTLGLLFLTHLKGHDIVLGKLAAGSLHSLYGLLGILPVLAMALLAGGVTFGEFGRVSLALVNTLFFTLAVGMWVSARSVQEQKALFGTLGLVAGAAGALPLLDTLLMGDCTGRNAFFSLGSPAVGCFLAIDTWYRGSPEKFWIALAMVHGTGWLLLWRASSILPAAVREEPGAFQAAIHPLPIRTARERTRHTAASPAQNRRLKRWLETKPLLWLAIRTRPLTGWVWGLLMISLLGGTWLNVSLASGTAGRQTLPSIYGLISFFYLAVFFALRLVLASMACRLFVEARQNQTLELLLTSPLARQDILRSQWAALVRGWLRPVFLVMIARELLLVALALSGHNLVRSAWTLSLVFQFLLDLADFFAVGWVGMWLAYSSRKPGSAVMKTFAYVVLLPWMFCSGLPMSTLIVRVGGASALSLLPSFIPALLKDLIFIFWARAKLRRVFADNPTRSP